ncbi:Hydroxyisourate hydrolase, partial [Atractiella rhizophila]
VLDSTSGSPAPEVTIRLERLTERGFIHIGDGATGTEGRCNDLLPVTHRLDAGIYKITFSTAEYFAKRGIHSFYPFVEIPFEIKNVEEHYHIPLLLAPYAYSTYRGS